MVQEVLINTVQIIKMHTFGECMNTVS